jgi:hypothetical protein
MQSVKVSPSPRAVMTLKRVTGRFTLATVLAGTAAASMAQTAPSPANSSNIFGPPAPAAASAAAPAGTPAASTPAATPAAPPPPVGQIVAPAPAPAPVAQVGATIQTPAPVAQAISPVALSGPGNQVVAGPLASEPAPTTAAIVPPNVPALIGLEFFHIRNVSQHIIGSITSVRIVVRR